MERVRPRLTLTGTPEAAAHGAILTPLIDYNVQRAGPHGRAPLAVLIEHPGTGEVLGGLWGKTSWQWLTIETLFVLEAHRAAGLGFEAVALAEHEAARRGCIGAWVDTHSFQAPGFYERLGYRSFGAIEDYPPGHSRIFLQKRF